MKQASLLLLVVAFAFAVSPLYAEVWVMATGHTHTYYSDGGNSIVTVGRRALATGSRFCAITDHVEAIETRKVGMLNVWQDVKFFGMADWIEDVRVGAAILHREGLDLVPGGEGALDTRPEGLMGANHVVMMGGPIAIYGQMQKLVIQSGDPDLMASRLHELASASGAVLIAAHPNCSAYKFDKALLKWVDAVEIFDGTADPLSELRVVASHPEAKSRTLAVVTGSDFHADNVTRLDTLGKMVRLKPVEMARAANPLARHIWAPVSSPKATREELIEAIKQRRTYASIAPARIVTAKTMPGGRHDTREVLGMRLDGMNWALGRSVHCLLVRRGSGDVRELEMPINVTGTVTGDFQLDFAKLPPAVLRDGSFLYLMVANQIATSGIELAPRPDVVVAKKRNLLQQAGDLLGQVAEVLAPTTTRSPSTAPRPPLNPSSPPTPPAFVPIPAPATALPIIATYAGELSGTSGYLPCRIRFDVLKDLCAVVTVVIRGADRPVIWQKQMACEKAHAFGSGKPMVRWALVYPTDNGLILDAPGEPQFQSEAGLSHVTGFVLIILQRPWANEIEFPDEIGERTGPTGFGYGAAGGRERFRTFALRRVK